MKKRKKQLFAPLNRSQWIGLLVLLLLIAMLITAMYITPRFLTSEDTANQLQINQTAALLQKSLRQEKRYHYKQYQTDTIAIFLHPFDPNTADSTELLQLGFKPWMAKNMLRYRAKGGKFRTKEKLKTVYGMTDELYSQIEPYIVIVQDSIPQKAEQKVYSEKRDTVLELNSADTTELKLIRGIGSYTARQIVRYRTELGGYYKPEQLREIPALQDKADSLLRYFTADTTLIEPLQVNFTKTERLQRHPYITFTQAKALYDLRRRKFSLKSVEDLRELPEFSAEDIIRISPYLDFSDHFNGSRH